MRIFLLACLLITAVTAAAFSAGPVSFAGDWAGTLDAGMKLRLAFHFVDTNGSWSGTMDSIDQGAKGIPFTAVTVDGTKLHAEIQAIAGAYDGTLDDTGNTIEGTWSQGGMNFPLRLVRSDAASLSAPARPQEPKPPFPYRSEDVTVPGPGGIMLAGTLTVPNGTGPFVTVLLITGSGPQDRDEALLGHRPFLVLSDYLTRRGIEVLRLDDRGVGKSTGNYSTATTEDFAEDALAAVSYLKSRPEVDAKKIGLVGHSEGGIIAPIVAVRSSNVAFIVMMAGVGVPMRDLMVRQSSDILRSNGASDEAVQYNAAAVRRMCQIATSEADTTLMRRQMDAVVDSLTAQFGALDPGKESLVRDQARASASMFMSPWGRHLIAMNPAVTLAKVKQPVLAINGSLDKQVSAQENLPAIEKVLKDGGNRDVTVVELPGLNHLFQTAQTGSPMEYASIEETMSPVAMKTIAEWILARTSPHKK